MKKQLILLHGAMGCKDDFRSIEPILTSSFDVHSFNFSGHGKELFSDKGFGIEVFSEELEAFIIKHDLNKPLVFGYSMGGYVALYLASKNKNIFGNILTLGTKFNWTPESADKETSRMNPDVMEVKIPAYTNMLYASHGKDWKTLVYQTAGMMIELGESPILIPDMLSVIEIPVSICLGDQDNMVSQEESNELAQQIPNGKFSLLPNTPHPIEKVKPDLIATVLTSML